MMGDKGSDPLVLAMVETLSRFLEGRINKSYCLILHLSNQELKTI